MRRCPSSFSFDFFGTASDLNPRDLIQCHLLSRRGAQEDSPDGVGISAVSVRHAERHGISFLTVNHLRDEIPGTTRSHGFLDVRDIESIPGECRTINVHR
jgi:hypothetical protein